MNNKKIASELVKIASELIASESTEKIEAEIEKLKKEYGNDPIMKRVETKIEELKKKCGDDKKLLKLKLFGLALKLHANSPLQNRVRQEINKLF
jgi:cellulose biosynthesis protein BcsQ